MSDQRTETGERLAAQDAEGAVARPPRIDPFAHGDLPLRPNYLPEEGVADRSEIWNVLKAVAIALVALLLISLVVTSR